VVYQDTADKYHNGAVVTDALPEYAGVDADGYSAVAEALSAIAPDAATPQDIQDIQGHQGQALAPDAAGVADMDDVAEGAAEEELDVATQYLKAVLPDGSNHNDYTALLNDGEMPYGDDAAVDQNATVYLAGDASLARLQAALPFSVGNSRYAPLDDGSGFENQSESYMFPENASPLAGLDGLTSFIPGGEGPPAEILNFSNLFASEEIDSAVVAEQIRAALGNDGKMQTSGDFGDQTANLFANNSGQIEQYSSDEVTLELLKNMLY
jgi:hypothetical protein